MTKLFAWIRRTFGVNTSPRRADHKYHVSIDLIYQAPNGRAVIGTFEATVNADSPNQARIEAVKELERGITYDTSIHRVYE